MSISLSPFVLRSHEGLTLKASDFEGFPATNLHNRHCWRFKLNLNFVVISQVAVETNYRCCLIEITLVMFQNTSKFTRRTVLKLLSNFYWVEKIISRFRKEFHFVDWFAIVLYYTHNLTLYISYFIVDITLACMMNIGTLRHSYQTSDSQKGNQHSSEKVEAKNVTQYRPVEPNPKHVLLEKCMALDTKPAFFTATFPTRH